LQQLQQQQQQQILPLAQAGPQFNRIQQQRSVQNQVQQPQNFFNNQPFQPTIVASPNFQDFNGGRPNVAPLIQQQQQPQPIQIQSQPQVRFPDQQRFQFAQSTQNQQFGQTQQPQPQIQIQPSLSTQFIPSPPEFLSNQAPTFNGFSQQLPAPQQQTQFKQFIPQTQFATQTFPQLPQQQQRTQFFQSQQQQTQQQQQQQQQQQNFNIPSEEELKQLREKEKIIAKHEQFVQKQYQKQQLKIQQEHDDFIKKQQQIKQQSASLVPQTQQGNRYQVTRSRGVLPQENPAFEQALKKWELEHPTTTTTTTTTPTPPTTAAKISVIPLANKSRNSKSDVSALNSGDLEVLLQGQRQQLLSQILQDTTDSKSKSKSKTKVAGSNKALGREDLLKQLKLALADQPQEELGDKNFTSTDIVLPNGQKVQVIRTSDPNLIQNGQFDPDSLVSAAPTPQASPISVVELAKSGILPEGADFEVIKQSADGQEIVQKIPPQKKVTFVYLEEQDDGSFKVQGVKGNNDKEVKTEGKEVDSILNRIKNGEIKLPPQSLKQTTAANPIIINKPNTVNTAKPTSVTVLPLRTVSDQVESDTISRSTARPVTNTIFESRRPSSQLFNSSPYSTVPTYSTTQTPFAASSPSASTPQRQVFASASPTFLPSTARIVATTQERQTYSSAPTFATTPSELPSPVPTSTSTTVSTAQLELTSVFRNSGLFAMSKYLKQSGLDSILNETGPYTIFVPTDKAFKSLLVQLGGPEKAEEKFKNNPRLLSGVSVS
jgi:Fasciclin domain